MIIAQHFSAGLLSRVAGGTDYEFLFLIPDHIRLDNQCPTGIR
jgi:hypothetical protein